MGQRRAAKESTGAQPPITTVIADDHAVVRSGLRAILEDDTLVRSERYGSRPFDLCAEATNGIEAIAAVKQYQPELLLLDVNMPFAGGAEVVNEIRRWSPKTRIAVFTGITAGATLAQLVDTGIEGLFSKTALEEELIEHLPALTRGGTFVSPSLLSILEADASLENLTNRERQVLIMVIKGKSNSEIAVSLSLSEKTVGNHRTRLMAKLNVHSLAELIAYALKAGLLSAGDSN